MMLHLALLGKLSKILIYAADSTGREQEQNSEEQPFSGPFS